MRLPWMLAALAIAPGLGAQAGADRDLRLGEVAEGEVTSASPEVVTERLAGAARGERWTVTGLPSGTFTIELRAYLFDPYLVLRDDAGAVLAEDDDGGVNDQARLVVELVEGRSYVLEACAPGDGAGPFELELTAGAPAPRDARARAAARLADLERAVEVIAVLTEPDSPRRVEAERELAWELMEQGLYARSRPRAERALALASSTLGPEHPETAQCLLTLAGLDYFEGDYARAIERGDAALAVLEGAPAGREESIETGLGLVGLCRLHLGDFPRAVEYLERVRAFAEATHGEDHEHTASAWNNLGGVSLERGDFARARECFRRSLEIRERVHPPDDPLIALSLNNLARALGGLGASVDAQACFERALSMRERALGPSAHMTVVTLTDLGLLLLNTGRPADARPYLERALPANEALFGREGVETAMSCNNLALLHHMLGNHETARALYLRALEVFRARYGEENKHTARTAANLAALHRQLGDPAAAIELLEEAVARRERIHGPDSPFTAFTLHDLGMELLEAGEVERALDALERVHDVRVRAYGTEHPFTLMADLGLGAAYYRIGAEAEARERLEHAAAGFERTLGLDNRYTASACFGLARFLADTGDAAGAQAVIRRVGAQGSGHVTGVLAAQSEVEAYRYMATRLELLELQLSLASAAGVRGELDAYQALLDRKGRVGRVMTASRAQLVAEMSEEQRELLQRLRDCQSELSRLVFIEAAGDAERDARADELGARRNALEVELRGAFRAFDTDVAWTEVRDALPAGAALLDLFVHREYLGDLAWSEPVVSAWVIRPGDEAPTRVPLGSEVALELAVKRYLDDVVARRGLSVESDDDALDPGAELRRLLWDPLAARLADVDTLFVAPDGALGTLPFGALPLGDGAFLIERMAVGVLQDAVSLTRLRPVGERSLSSLLSVGGVDFGRRADEEPLAAAAERAGFSGYWGRLPATTYEARVLQDMHADAFDAEDARRTLLLGEDATEERLKRELPRHAVLHLATHGFFQPEGMPSMWERVRDEEGGSELRLRESDERLLGSHPGLLSGLVCAGANAPVVAERDDAYLTAEEVGWLDLSDVELVVLSACETGLGRAQSGEGLLGLRRAFHTAGADTVVSSLWSVRDETTSKLMQSFYLNLWLRGMGRLEALRAAQLELLDRNRIGEGGPLPSTWAAFVLSGDWR